MTRLDGKYALITGGTSGIGLETARQFLAEGAKVAITGRNPQALLAAGKTLTGSVLAHPLLSTSAPEGSMLETLKHGGSRQDDVSRDHSLVLIQSDAGDIAAQGPLAALISHHWPRLDILFANAGDVTHRPLQDWDEAAYDRLMNTNLKGPFFLVQALLPLLANPSSVILCGSVSAHIGLAQSSAYAASKAGLLSLARTLSGELLGRGVRVNGLSPGPTDTAALGKLGLAHAEETALRTQIKGLVPIGRLGTPWELARAAVFLASDESSFVVGTELQVDGGVGNL